MTSGVAVLRRVILACEAYRAAIDEVYGIGLTESQALSQLAVHGEVSPRDLGDALGLTSGSITNVLDRLEAADLVERRPHPGDRRRLIVALTDRSRSIIATSNDYYTEMIASLQASGLPDVEQFLGRLADALTATSGRLVAHLQDDQITAARTPDAARLLPTGGS